MKIHTLTKEEVLRTLVTSEKGLSEKEAGRRLQEYGRNEIREVRKGGLYLRFLSQFTHFLAVLLWIAAALCLLSEYMHPGEGMLLLALAVIAVICINAIFTFIQEYRAERALEALRRLLPFNVKVVREGTTREVNATEVVPGDIIVLAEGDRVPADARIVDSGRLMVDNAPLTGESEAKPRTHEPFDGDLLDSPNIVFAGTHSVSGTCKAVVFATGMSTEFGKIAHLTSAVKPGLSPLQKELLKVTRVIALIAVTTGAFFFGLGFVVGKSFWHNLLFAIGITIANVPEGLLPTVTLSLAMGSQRMAKRKALIKTLTSVETLGSVTVICSDKTGTLTQGKMAVTRIWYENRFIEAEEPDMTNAHELMRIAYLCNNARFVDGQYRGDATEVALLKVVREAIGDLESERVLEIPFDSERKRMTTIDRVDRQLLVHTKGAFETVLPLCDRIRWGGETIVLREEQREALTDAYHSMTDEGLRVISFAFSPQEESETSLQSSPDAAVESRLIFAGLMGIEDPPRPEVPDAIRKCREAGIKVVMITGDAARTAVAIGKQIGLSSDDARVVEGSLLDHMPDAGVRECLTAREIIFARMNPRHKMRIVSVLKDEGERVAVTGDGVNDAPALKKADVGIAMGIAGTDVAKETADVVLLDDNFATIVNAVEEGRATFDNIRKFITYIFAHGT
ncbi:MAG: cation-translocating P-type ATPase, partial [Deltaproteobacteria bacterium]